jgi:lipase chaperone LimK
VHTLFAIAYRVRANVLAATKIANDPSLTQDQKIAAIQELKKNPPLDSHT